MLCYDYTYDFCNIIFETKLYIASAPPPNENFWLRTGSFFKPNSLLPFSTYVHQNNTTVDHKFAFRYCPFTSAALAWTGVRSYYSVLSGKVKCSDKETAQTKHLYNYVRAAVGHAFHLQTNGRTVWCQIYKHEVSCC